MSEKKEKQRLRGTVEPRLETRGGEHFLTFCDDGVQTKLDAVAEVDERVDGTADEPVQH